MGNRFTASSASISVDSESNSHGSHGAESVNSVLIELLDRFNRREIPATWAFHDPAEALIATRIAAHSVKHEIAILDDAVAVHSQFSRAYLLNGVGRRIRAAAAAGISISTLAVFDDWQPANIDLLTKFGLAMIRGHRPLEREASCAVKYTRGIQGICYGLSYAPTSCLVDGGKWLANRMQLRQVLRTIDRAIDRGEHCHIRIDAATLAEGDAAESLRAVDRWLRHLAQLRDGGQVSISTLRETVQQARPKRAIAAHSILRAA